MNETLFEAWRQIPGWIGYEVSDLGRIKSWRRAQHGAVMSPRLGNTGYLSVALRDESGQRRVRKNVHALVMLAFVGPRPDGLMVRHLDGNPLNNTLANLRYGTSTENHDDSVRHGTHYNAKKTECPHGHPYSVANTIPVTKPDGRVGRRCRECERLRRLARVERSAA